MSDTHDRDIGANHIFLSILILLFLTPVAIILYYRLSRPLGIKRLPGTHDIDGHTITIEDHGHDDFQLHCHRNGHLITVEDLVTHQNLATLPDGSIADEKRQYDIIVIDSTHGEMFSKDEYKYGAQTHFIMQLPQLLPEFSIKPVGAFARRLVADRQQLVARAPFADYYVLRCMDPDAFRPYFSGDFQNFYAGMKNVTCICSGERLIMYQYGRLLRASEIKRMLGFMLAIFEKLDEKR